MPVSRPEGFLEENPPPVPKVQGNPAEPDWGVGPAKPSLDKAKAAAEKLQSVNSKVRVVELDIADDQSIDQAVKHLSQEIPQLDVLVNNAGIYPDEGVNILTISRELLNQTINTNAFGPIRTSQAFLPILSKASQARIINLSSGYGQLNGLSFDVPSYCLSKLTLNGATIMLADALQAKGIAVYAMNPGWVKTDMGGASAPRSPEQGLTLLFGLQPKLQQI